MRKKAPSRSRKLIVVHTPILYLSPEYGRPDADEAVFLVHIHDPHAYKQLKRVSAKNVRVGFIADDNFDKENEEQFKQIGIMMEKLPRAVKETSRKKRFYPRVERLSNIVSRVRLREKILKTKIMFWDYVSEPGISHIWGQKKWTNNHA